MIKFRSTLIPLILTLAIVSCKEDEVLPSVVTTEASLITATTAQSGGKIVLGTGSDILAVGVCWSVEQTPTVADQITSDSLSAEFTSLLVGLIPRTNYYTRAYIKTKAGISYGNTISFTTSAEHVPIVMTEAIDSLSTRSVKIGGVIISDGGNTVLESGICFSLMPGPSIGDAKVRATGNSFSVKLSNLYPNTVYYARAYAINNHGVGYSSEISIKTIANAGWEYFNKSNSSMEQESITAIAVDGSGVAWIGAQNYLIAFDGHSFTNYKYTDLPSKVKKIVIDQFNNKWLLTTSGLYKFNNSIFKSYGSARQIILHADATLSILRTGVVLEKLKIEQDVFESCSIIAVEEYGNYVFSLEHVDDVAQDISGRAFCTSVGGITSWVYMSDTNNLCYKHTKLFSIWEVWSIDFNISPDSLVYISTQGGAGGLHILDKNLKVNHVGSQDITSVAFQDDGTKVWLGCMVVNDEHFKRHNAGGLQLYSPGHGFLNSYRTTNSGLLHDNVFAVAVMNNKILAGTQLGLSVFSPE